MTKSLASVVSSFGGSAKSKLANPAISGAPEDQLRGPLEVLIRDLAELGALAPGSIHLVGETSLAELKTRPDFAVTVSNALVGFIEVKAPGKGADPRKFTDPHDKDQWSKLKALPNLLYTDGNAFSVWRNGEIEGKVVRLEGNIEESGTTLEAPLTLIPLISDFLRWTPIPPKNAKKLAEISARLCRLLRDEVVEQMAVGSPALTGLAEDWRVLLFPQATNAEFADGYSQALTFGLLVARARGISLATGIDDAAQELRKTNSLIGTALRLLTDDAANQEALKTSLGTLARVLEEVDWPTISKDKPEAWLYFYEDFLEVYDKTLRKRTGSYYTPPEVVGAMVQLVDEALRSPTLFDRPAGFASPDVTVADPAVGTGTFLLGVFRSIAETVEQDQGSGAVPGAVAAAAKRLIGFELQFGPFAVAQLRLIAEMRALIPKGQIADVRLYVTDTLGNPYAEEEPLPQILLPIGRSRREANAIKRSEPITVVIGNPPYKVDAAGRGGWIESGSDGRPSAMDLWAPPPEWRVGQSAKHLKNLYVYFWRWATWKVFGSGHAAITGEPDIDRAGLVCFITAAGFLNGPGFQKMREDLRRDCVEIWVIDCSPEGHQPEVATRIFQGVQQQVCIVLAARTPGKDRLRAARLRFKALPEGRREEKFAALARLTLDGRDWIEGPADWRDPFLPQHTESWAGFVPLPELFQWANPGVKTHRTWVISPDAQSLDRRWNALQHETNAARKAELFHPDSDRTLDKIVKIDLGPYRTRPVSVGRDKDSVVPPVRYAFRSFDRQWIVPDHRLLSRARPKLWDRYSAQQVYLTALEAHSPSSGPAISFAGLIPDQHHYHGRGGHAYPLWCDPAATEPNIRSAIIEHLADIYAQSITAADLTAYLAAVMAHPAFTRRFAANLVRPGLRIPLTADATMFAEAVSVGREVIWLHCYGERFYDPAAGRPRQAPRPKRAPIIPADGAIPSAPEPLPDSMDYDPATRRLHVGRAYVENVTPEMWHYEVSGQQVVWHWFSCRRRDRSRPIIGDRRPPSPLDGIQPDGWLASTRPISSIS